MSGLSIFTKIKLRRLKKLYPIPSSLVLSIVYGKSFVQSAAAMSTDPREFISNAAKQGNLSEVELLAKLSVVTGYPFLIKIPLVDLRALPRNANLDRFRAYGCIPIARGGRIEALVCNEPGMLEPILSGLKPIPIFLATWSVIATTIEQSKEETARRVKVEETEKVIKLTSKAQQLLEPTITAPVGSFESSSGREKVMIIDDNKTFGSVIERFLAKQGCKTISFNTAEQAMPFLLSNTDMPGVVVCDLHMPGMNGIEFLKQIRLTYSAIDLPVLILTSDTNAETEIEAIEKGADIYLRKTEDPRVLCAHIFSALRRKTVRAAA